MLCNWLLRSGVLHLFFVYLFHLKFDSRLDFIDLGHYLFIVSEEGRELASFVQTLTQGKRNLFDQGL